MTSGAGLKRFDMGLSSFVTQVGVDFYRSFSKPEGGKSMLKHAP